MVNSVLRMQNSHNNPEQTISSLIVHSILLSDEATSCQSVGLVSLVLLITNICLQNTIRLTPATSGARFTDALTGSWTFAVAVLCFIGLMCLYFTCSLTLPVLRRSQRDSVDAANTPNFFGIYFLAHIANFFVVTPLLVGLLLGAALSALSGVQFGTPSTSMAIYALLAVAMLGGLCLVFYFTTMYLGITRPKDFFSCTSRLPPLVQSVTLCLALATERTQMHGDQHPAAKIVTFVIGFASLVWLASGLVLGVYRTSFHSGHYRMLTLLGMAVSIVSEAINLCRVASSGSVSVSSSILLLICVTVLAAIALSNLRESWTFPSTDSKSVSFFVLSNLEDRLQDYRSALSPSTQTLLFEMAATGLSLSKRLVDPFFYQPDKHKLPINTPEVKLELFAEYVFELYYSNFTQSKQQLVDPNFSFAFAHFLLRWKKHIFLLSTLHRLLAASSLSLRHTVSLAVLETAITRQLRAQDSKFSYFFTESPSSVDSSTSRESVDVYHIIETVSGFESLIEQMRLQIRLQTQFLLAVENRSQTVAQVHNAVKVITEQRSHCKQLFDELHNHADSAQTFHLLPFAFFLEHTENNLERRVELVKTYYFKSQGRRAHSRLFNELVDRSVTVVTDSERTRLGQITHSSKNVGLVFGADVTALEGRSLDIFFHPEMAAVHRRQMRDFLQHFDRPYLGDHRERYVTVGNNVYYRVDCVTKFVPHLREGFQFVTMMKHLAEETGKYGKMDASCLQLMLDDRLRIIGVGYNQSLLRKDYENDAVSKNAASNKGGISTDKVALNTALSILPQIQGKNLSVLSFDMAERVSDQIEQMHKGDSKPEGNLDGQMRLGPYNNHFNMPVIRKASLESEVSPAPSTKINPALSSRKESPAVSKPQIPVGKDQQSQAFESGDFVVSIDIAKGMVISETDNELTDSEGAGSEDDKTHVQTIQPNSKLRLFLNFTHFCLKSGGNNTGSPAGWRDKKGKYTALSSAKTSRPPMELKAEDGDLRTDMLVADEMDLPTNFSRSGLTVLRIMNPHKLGDIAMNNILEKMNLSMDLKHSVFDLGGEFDPVKLIVKLMNIRECQELILNYMTKPDLAEIPQKSLTVEGSNLEIHDFGDATPITTPKNQGSAGQIMMQKFFPEGQIQLAIPEKYSNVRTNSLDNNVVSANSLEVSQAQGLYPRQTTRDKQKDGKSILSKALMVKKKPAAKTLGPLETARDKSTSKSGTGGNQTATDSRAHTKGILGKVVERNSKQKSKTMAMKTKIVDPDEQSLKSHKTVSKGPSVQKDAFLGEHGTKRSAREELAASIGGQSIASSRMSEINIHRTLWWMIKHPSANNSSKVVVFAVMILFWAFCHTYQAIMLGTFANAFNGIADLQNLFGLFINFDSYVKATAKNIMDREVTFDLFGYPPDRYKRFNPNLVDIVEQSKLELPIHTQQAYTYRKYMSGNLSLLMPTEVTAFTHDNLILKNMTVVTSEAQPRNNILGQYMVNSLQTSLMVLYDLRVWNEDITRSGSWAALNFYRDSIDGWFELLKLITESFGTSYTAKIAELDNLSVAISLSGLFVAQVLILVVLYKFNHVRNGIIKNITVVQCLRHEEISAKQHRLSMIDEYLSKEIYVGSDSKQSISSMISAINKAWRNRTERGVTSGRPQREQKDKSRPSKGKGAADRQEQKLRLVKSSPSKIKSTFLEWFGMGLLAIVVVVLIEFQSVINILTAAQQRSTSVSYREWLSINQHYYLLEFYMTNMPMAIYIDNGGDIGLFDLVDDLHHYVYEYSTRLDNEATQLVRQVLAKQSDAQTYGYQKFFQNPCDLIDLSIYNLPKESCNALNSGVIQRGFIRFIDIDRLNFIRLNATFHGEPGSDYHTSETNDFATVAFHLKNVHQMMFPLINQDILLAAQNFNNITWQYAVTYGVVFQIGLSALGLLAVLLWMVVADAKLSTAVSVYLILPAESLALNHYVRAQVKNLFDSDKLD